MAKKRVARKPVKRAKKTVKKRTVKSAKKATRGPAKRTAKKRAVKKRAVKKRAVKKRAVKRATTQRASSASQGPLTLTEVSKRTGISMPTLQRYKKLYQRRLETVGKGRTQRYAVASLDTFQQIKKENLKKRGRPRKSAASKVSKRSTQAKAAPEGLISLSEIGRRTGISYPTLLRYVRLHSRRIPSHGTGRKRRFPVEAVPVFSQLRKESRRGRRKGSPAKKAPAAASGMEARMLRLEKSQAGLEKQIAKLVKALRQPLVKGI